MIDFTGRVLLMTGANGAIPRAIARAFHALGASLALTDLRPEPLLDFAHALDPVGGRTLVEPHDVSRSEDAVRVAERAAARFGGIDFVVTGAGLYLDQGAAGMTDAQWRQMLAVNLDGVFYTCRAAVPHLRDNGAIVNIASMAGHRGSALHAHYAAAKGAVLAFSRSLAKELAPRIRVNAVSPGLIDTPMVQPLLAADGPQLLAQTPQKRLGRPDEIGGAIAFLCSDWASFITAETLHINGGLHIAS